MKDISILKDMLKIEKANNQKKDAQLKAREAELKQTRENALEHQTDWLNKSNENTLKL